MSLALTLHTAPAVPLEADVISPARFAGLSPLEAAKLIVVHGTADPVFSPADTIAWYESLKAADSGAGLFAGQGI